MKRIELSAGVTRVRLAPEDAADFRPVLFSDAGGTFLRQTGFACEERPVYRLEPSRGGGEVKQPASARCRGRHTVVLISCVLPLLESETVNGSISGIVT